MTLMHWMWIAIGVIGITAVIKTAVLISRRRNERNNTSDNRNRVHIPVETSVSSATETGPMVYFLQMTGTDSTTGNTGLTTRR